MMDNKAFKIGELILLFLSLPLFLTLDILPAYKLIAVIIGIGYCIWVSIKMKLMTKQAFFQINFKDNWKRLLLTFVLVCLSSTLFLYFVQPENLFIVVKKKPLLWLVILFVYAFLSVYPQELLYRSFFFKRYTNIFSKPYYLIWTNILVFPIAHLFFDNLLVLVVTFIGGIFFTLTYYRTKSVLLTSVEHALYGNWLFTLGMGEMLAFPMPS